MTYFLHRVKYGLAHLPSSTMTSMKDLRAQLTLQNVQYVPEVVLVVAIGLGLWTQWTVTQNVFLSFIALSALLLFAMSCAMRYYCGLERVGGTLYHIWVGCLVGILAYSDSKELEYIVTQEVMEALFLTSLVLAVFWHVLSRLLKLADANPGLLGTTAGCEGLGLMIAGIETGSAAPALALVTLAFLTHVAAIRLRSTPAILSLAGFVVIAVLYIFPQLSLHPNIYALVCLTGHHLIPAVLDLYLCGRTLLERWQATVFVRHRLWRHMALLVMLVLDLALAVVVGASTMQHKEWFVVFPLFLAAAAVWLLLHVAFFAACWQLMGKVTACNAAHSSLGESPHSYPRVMAARGLRHFGLVTQRLICLSLSSTLLLLALGWETRTSYSLALTFTVIPLEAAVLSLFWDLGEQLGGTCTSYGIVSPVSALRPGDGATLMSAAAVQEMTTQGMMTLAQVQHFFAFHMLANYGCDFSTSGMSLESLQNKLTSFFDQRTSEGPRYDTYLLYYCGDVFTNGDWALTDNKRLTLDTLLEWWEAKNGTSGARLILLLDSLHSYEWAHEVRQLSGAFCAVQTCRYIHRAIPDVDSESGQPVGVGAFTRAFVQHNTGQQVAIDWSSKQRPLRALYSTSRCWCDFTFHLPTRDDYRHYWDNNFPKCTRPLLKALNIPGMGSIFCFCTCLGRWMRRLQMSCLPPREVDTGHGFKLIRT